MSPLPAINSTVLAITLAVIAGGAILVMGALGISNPLLLRMGLRNMLRRPGQTLILLCGLVLSTVVMTASFGLWDSFSYSTFSYELKATGNVDESVAGDFSQTQVNAALATIQHNPNVQAASGIIIDPRNANITSVRTRLTLESVDIYAVPPDFEQVYGPLTDSQGQVVQLADLSPDQVLLSAILAQHFAVQPGERVQLSIGSQTITSTVHALLSNDLAVLSDNVATPTPEVILPLARYQQIQVKAPNVICMKNSGPGGMGDHSSGQQLLNPKQIHLDLAGHPLYFTPYQAPLVADKAFLSATTLALSARAQGYTSDQQVWNAVRDYPGYVVLRYEGGWDCRRATVLFPFTQRYPMGTCPPLIITR